MAANDNTPKTTKTDLEHEQVNIIDRGVDRSAKRRGQLDASSSAVHNKLIENYIWPIVDVMKDEIWAAKKRRGQNPSWVAAVERVRLEDGAYTALMCTLDGHEKEWSYTTLVNVIGRAFACLTFETIMQETRQGRRLCQRLEQNATLKSDKIEKRQDYVFRMAKSRGFDFADWEGGEDGLIHNVGSAWVSVVEKGCQDIFERKKDRRDEDREHPEKFIVLRPEVEAEISEKLVELDRLSPYFSPMNTKPRPWGLDQIGPYKTPSLAIMTPLVKHASPQQKADIDAGLRDGSLNAAVDALNIVQEVPYEINAIIVDAVDWVRKRGIGKHLNKFPNTITVPKPKLEEGETFETLPKRKQVSYMRHLTRSTAVNRQARANRSKIRRTLNEAREFLTYDCFYLPHNWDRRGRVYHVCDFGHHNTDYIRAMFQFHNKVEMTEDNLVFLCIQLANSFGLDKEGFPNRLDWVQDNLQAICDAGIDFKKHFDFWSQADEPFQFLAGCRDMAEYQVAKQNGEKHMSGLPIGQDATQSGIQHYAAASLNLEDGRLVNLVKDPSRPDKPADMYQACLDVCEVLIQDDLHEMLVSQHYDPANDNDREAFEAYQATLSEQVEELDPKALEELDAKKAAAKREYRRTDAYRRLKRDQDIVTAQTLLSEETPGKKYLNRSVMKRPTMTWAYSSRKYGFAKQFKKDWMDEMDLEVRRGEREFHPFGDDGGYNASHYLAGKAQTAIESTIKSAKQGMEFFQKCAQIMAEADLHLTFKTPILNFPMHQFYREGRSKERRVYMYNQSADAIQPRQSMYYTSFTNAVLGSKSVSAVSPNMIHSMDATLLMLTILRCADRGVTDLMVVHDSFSTTVADVQTLREAFKEAMIEMYDGYCIYTDLLQQCQARHPDPDSVEWPQVPDKGDLPIEKIYESDYILS
jgi:DNA-directed RNA polymerase